MDPLLRYDQTVARYRAYLPGAKDITRDPLYDNVVYAAAGQTNVQLFSVPRGAGTSPQTGAGPKTIADTNMTQASQLSAGVDFLVEDIELLFFPGGQLAVGGLASATPQEFADDVFSFLSNGSLAFTVLNKIYVNQAPLIKFPPAQRLVTESAIADTTTAAATSLTSFQYASGAGALWKLSPAPLLISSNTNFSIDLTWPAAIALPSAVAGLIYCTLGGVLYRRVQ